MRSGLTSSARRPRKQPCQEASPPSWQVGHEATAGASCTFLAPHQLQLGIGLLWLNRSKQPPVMVRTAPLVSNVPIKNLCSVTAAQDPNRSASPCTRRVSRMRRQSATRCAAWIGLRGVDPDGKPSMADEFRTSVLVRLSWIRPPSGMENQGICGWRCLSDDLGSAMDGVHV